MPRPERLALINDSFRHFTGHALVEPGDDLAVAMWTAPHAIVAHGIEPDPIFFYGNALALRLFETSLEDFMRLPSRLSAESSHRDERARLLARVARDGFIGDYAGIRISASGRRFRIEQAVVWNLIDAAGQFHGQAATFDRWTPLDP